MSNFMLRFLFLIFLSLFFLNPVFAGGGDGACAVSGKESLQGTFSYNRENATIIPEENVHPKLKSNNEIQLDKTFELKEVKDVHLDLELRREEFLGSESSIEKALEQSKEITVSSVLFEGLKKPLGENELVYSITVVSENGKEFVGYVKLSIFSTRDVLFIDSILSLPTTPYKNIAKGVLTFFIRNSDFDMELFSSNDGVGRSALDLGFTKGSKKP